MSTNTPKFQYPGIVPFPIEFEKTKEEITEDYFQATKGPYATNKIGTLYPFSLSFQDMVKFYWRMKKLNFSVNVSSTYKYNDAESECTLFSTETVTIENDEGLTTIEPSDALDSLKQRVCNLYDVKYKTKSVWLPPTSSLGTNDYTWEAYLDLYASHVYSNESNFNRITVPAIVAECEGDPSEPGDYIYYPRMEFSFWMWNDGWGTYLNYNSEDESPQNQKTINIKLDGQTVGSFTMHMVSHNQHAFCELERNSSDFSDWDFELWSEPQ